MANEEFLELIAESLDEVNEYCGDSFFYGGAEYRGIISELEFESSLESGGLIQERNTVIIVPLTQLETTPEVGQTVKIGTKTLRIDKVASDEISWELTCDTAAK